MGGRCAFLTLADPTGYHIDDHLAAEVLHAAGWMVETVPWNTPDEDWSRFDVAVVRSTWDYHRHVDAFFGALAHIQSAGTRLFNHPDLMRWNADKRYLADLAEGGIAVVPTLFGRRLERGDTVHFAGILEATHLVIKPVRGANAEGTFRITIDDEPDAALSRFAADDFMVQPFVRSIQTEGEVSLFYFGGAYSHAIQKTPTEGDFRVQEEHGGTIRPWTADQDALRAGALVLRFLQSQWSQAPTLYARVDLVRGEDDWWLIELEVIEPSMYFRMDEGAAGRFVDAFLEVIH